MKSERPVTTVVMISSILAIAIVAGAVFTYGDQPDRSVSVGWGAGSVDVTVSSEASDVYDALLIDNGTKQPVTSLAIYVDDTYDEHYDAAADLLGVGIVYFSQQYYAEQMVKFLSFRGFTDVRIVDADGLAEWMASESEGKGVLVTSYALPENVYDGTSESVAYKWVDDGGTLYWAGSIVGGIHYRDGAPCKTEDPELLFFGKTGVTDCHLEYQNDYVAEGVVGNGFTDALSLKCANTQFGIDIEGMDGIQMGFERDGHATVSAVGLGQGDVVVFSGTPSVYLMDDMGQIIASGVTSQSVLLGTEHGEVTRGERNFEMQFDETLDPILYVYTGGIYCNHGERFQ